MRPTHRHISTITAVLLVSALFGATAPGGFADNGRDRPLQDSTHATVAPAPAINPAEVGPIEADQFPGAEPDPEAFDQRGLEIWWQRYQDALKKAFAQDPSQH